MRVRNAISALRVPTIRSFKPAAGMIQMGKHVSTALPYIGKAPCSKEAGKQRQVILAFEERRDHPK